MTTNRLLPLVLIVAVLTLTTACSDAQLRHFAYDVCRGLENCTAYDDDANAGEQDWDPPVSRPRP